MTGQKGDRSFGGEVEELEVSISHGHAERKQFRKNPGRPLQAYYKGVHRGIHDGGGLKSPGRWLDGRPAPVDRERRLIWGHAARSCF